MTAGGGPAGGPFGVGPDGNSRCLPAAPSSKPPFTAIAEQNGGQDEWCLCTAPDYRGSLLRIPPFSRAYAGATFASGRPC
ncbi:hypothetical protein [Amycolatopsis sp. DG1A-15b]|uniref:hypothetical protein n=1 Tax=Amycolatopsis sp. DG1A-15b TaxID=3052846 RepID=UPI00255BA2D7|nr:hypothetical protein [Amycolatopsis sp. DG1A-15b]WIX89036.1 hypothetical protein QRY02_00875 [Amycolatopsis sp. DG1A-15b]